MWTATQILQLSAIAVLAIASLRSLRTPEGVVDIEVIEINY